MSETINRHISSRKALIFVLGLCSGEVQNSVILGANPLAIPCAVGFRLMSRQT